MTLAERVKHLREARKLTQLAFAQALGISAQYLCDLEHGRRPGSVEFVDKVCDWLGCTKRSSIRRTWHLAGARQHGWRV